MPRFVRRQKVHPRETIAKGPEAVWEIERTGSTLLLREGDETPDTREFPSEDFARYAMGELIAKRQRHGFVLVALESSIPGSTWVAGSVLALDEYFEAGDDRFHSEVLRVTAGPRLAALAPRWYADKRPWARAALLAYVDDGCDRPEHKGLVKRLFKLAETAADDEVMAHFVAAFDRLARRALIDRTRYDWQTRLTTTEGVLTNDLSLVERLRDPKKDTLPTFTRVTRRYLARRAYRYFRRLGHRDVVRYGTGMRIALPLYRDEFLASAARFLDAWGLVHALYGRSPVIMRRPRGLLLADGTRLADLVPAPQFPAAWAGVFDDLLAIVFAARSRTVRGWTIAMLRLHHRSELDGLRFPIVKRMLTSPNEEVQALGAELFGRLPGLDALPISEWLGLLAIDNFDVIPVVCTAVERHVAPARLSLAQCIDLAGAKIAQVAELGLRWARDKPVTSADDIAAIVRLAKVGVATVRADGTAWVVSVLATHALATANHLRDLCDAPHADARAPALAAVAGTERFTTVPTLWLALTESPYHDVRAFVSAHAASWQMAASPATMQQLWRSAVLAIHTGSRDKRRVPRAIADRIASHPGEARELLPVLGFALRSVRAAERAPALVALVRTLRADPVLASLARELLPELTVGTQVTA